MTVEKFKTKHKELFNIGACSHNQINNSFYKGEELIIDRYVDGEFVCDRKDIDRAQADARKMGFYRYGVGSYLKPKLGSSF